MSKRRVTVTVDEELIDAVTTAVDQGQARSVSAWISGAIEQRRDHERRLAELASLITAYEAEHGVITEEELADQAQADRDAAALLRVRHRATESGTGQ